MSSVPVLSYGRSRRRGVWRALRIGVGLGVVAAVGMAVLIVGSAWVSDWMAWRGVEAKLEVMSREVGGRGEFDAKLGRELNYDSKDPWGDSAALPSAMQGLSLSRLFQLKQLARDWPKQGPPFAGSGYKLNNSLSADFSVAADIGPGLPPVYFPSRLFAGKLVVAGGEERWVTVDLTHNGVLWVKDYSRGPVGNPFPVERLLGSWEFATGRYRRSDFKLHVEPMEGKDCFRFKIVRIDPDSRKEIVKHCVIRVDASDAILEGDVEVVPSPYSWPAPGTIAPTPYRWRAPGTIVLDRYP